MIGAVYWIPWKILIYLVLAQYKCGKSLKSDNVDFGRNTHLVILAKALKQNVAVERV